MVDLRRRIEEAAAFLNPRLPAPPEVALILGSGLSELVAEAEEGVAIPYEAIPHFPRVTVEGHAGELLAGRLEGRWVVALRGRFHYYEGYSMEQITFPVRVMRALGASILIVTNAAGGITPELEVGDLMRIVDHINLPGLAGISPLRGPNDPELGPRFPALTHAYDRRLGALAEAVARELGFELKRGVYVMNAGPAFETPAEVRLLQTLGGDAVGMSTVPEVLVAVHSGMRVLGISLISNINLGDPDTVPNHEEVLAAAAAARPRFAALLRGILRRLEEAL